MDPARSRSKPSINYPTWENPVVIEKILTHLNEKTASAATGLLLQVQAPPQAGLFD